MAKNSGSLIRTMLSIAIPVTLQNLLFSSFTLVDTLMIGQLGDTPLAAVGMAGKCISDISLEFDTMGILSYVGSSFWFYVVCT